MGSHLQALSSPTFISLPATPPGSTEHCSAHGQHHAGFRAWGDGAALPLPRDQEGMSPEGHPTAGSTWSRRTWRHEDAPIAANDAATAPSGAPTAPNDASVAPNEAPAASRGARSAPSDAPTAPNNALTPQLGSAPLFGTTQAPQQGQGRAHGSIPCFPPLCS